LFERGDRCLVAVIRVDFVISGGTSKSTRVAPSRSASRADHFAETIWKIAIDDACGGIANWLGSWLIAWTTTIPIVVLAAPAIRRLVLALTIDSDDHGKGI
jgi:hypothetical protein